MSSMDFDTRLAMFAMDERNPAPRKAVRNARVRTTRAFISAAGLLLAFAISVSVF
ncbi:hypothetical protein [Pseudodesulfovibrio senegalensis]|jgi:hypothetical protein|uniref:hypothetical protein n=1 Tax=Pseudodesulfovibrio senegalensis TaxID=1721087 RepID=UPI00137572E0|nr:hypothetical protein [Pseudodesulfovibrio senegalensis]